MRKALSKLMTTHSPWAYSRFKAAPEQIVVLYHHHEGYVHAKNLAQMEDYEKIYADENLSSLASYKDLLFFIDIK